MGNHKKINTLGILLVYLLSTACTDKSNEAFLTKEIQAIKTEFAPDKRVALFNVMATQKDGSYILKGESNLPDAVTVLKEVLKTEEIAFVDSIQMLPSSDLKGKTNALINNSVGNLRSNPKHSAELATQATLGTPVKVLKRDGDWYYIQTPDKYLSWVDGGGIVSLIDKEIDQWKDNKKIMYTKTYGHSYADIEKSGIVSDLVAGSVLEVLKTTDLFYLARYPDGRTAYVLKTESEPYDSWLAELDPSLDDLVTTSKKLVGTPYLWGGTSTKGMDCSGFTKTVYFLNGMVIPRDASQQVHTGKQIDEDQNFDKLEKGDLLFFGRKATDSTKERVVHVGMWIGNNEFIHASNQVRISSMDAKAENFDAYNLNRYLRAKRILKEEDEDLIHLKRSPVFND
jgi:uncharacterized protein YgiM (DUF1202 family)